MAVKLLCVDIGRAGSSKLDASRRAMAPGWHRLRRSRLRQATDWYWAGRVASA
ncbi:hypothetical protein [Cupriavidus pauculus]|uniref:hypothetical protein n=1 Tax=Cupriavidus pauculus TaxID=82633 RepID=UPI0015DF4C64|nr:hypothetical protein [Cupriavidus pauculus]